LHLGQAELPPEIIIIKQAMTGIEKAVIISAIKADIAKTVQIIAFIINIIFRIGIAIFIIIGVIVRPRCSRISAAAQSYSNCKRCQNVARPEKCESVHYVPSLHHHG
jgi:hypothetical protein